MSSLQHKHAKIWDLSRQNVKHIFKWDEKHLDLFVSKYLNRANPNVELKPVELLPQQIEAEMLRMCLNRETNLVGPS